MHRYENILSYHIWIMQIISPKELQKIYTSTFFRKVRKKIMKKV